MKNDNSLWGVKKIQGELMKINIQLDTKTIWNIITHFRRIGKIKKSLTWKKFLLAQINSIYAMDIFTVDTIRNQRFYVHFIIAHKTREILRFAITENQTKEFIRQQLIELEQQLERLVYIIHDNAVAFKQAYGSYGMKGVPISVCAPNMNAIAERFVSSVRYEALDNFILLGQGQIKRILAEYVEYYNSQRPHQGIGQKSPIPLKVEGKGSIQKIDVLGGLHHHYYRVAA